MRRSTRSVIEAERAEACGRLQRANLCAGQIRQASGEGRPAQEPGVPGPPFGDALFSCPAGNLDEGAQARHSLVPVQGVGIDRDSGPLLILTHESASEPDADALHSPAEQDGHNQWRLFEQQRGVANVECPRREQRGAPIQHPRPIAIH